MQHLGRAALRRIPSSDVSENPDPEFCLCSGSIWNLTLIITLLGYPILYYYCGAGGVFAKQIRIFIVL